MEVSGQLKALDGLCLWKEQPVHNGNNAAWVQDIVEKIKIFTSTRHKILIFTDLQGENGGTVEYL
jgi:hypothetical protein